FCGLDRNPVKRTLPDRVTTRASGYAPRNNQPSSGRPEPRGIAGFPAAAGLLARVAPRCNAGFDLTATARRRSPTSEVHPISKRLNRKIGSPASPEPITIQRLGSPEVLQAGETYQRARRRGLRHRGAIHSLVHRFQRVIFSAYASSVIASISAAPSGDSAMNVYSTTTSVTSRAAARQS